MDQGMATGPKRRKFWRKNGCGEGIYNCLFLFFGQVFVNTWNVLTCFDLSFSFLPFFSRIRRLIFAVIQNAEHLIRLDRVTTMWGG